MFALQKKPVVYLYLVGCVLLITGTLKMIDYRKARLVNDRKGELVFSGHEPLWQAIAPLVSGVLVIGAAAWNRKR
jgi:uncharacterized membrane protein HdeD (DUF308 family)